MTRIFTDFIKKRIYLILLLTIFVLISINHLYWLSHDNLIDSQVPMRMLTKGVQLFQMLHQPGMGVQEYKVSFEKIIDFMYPNLISLLIIPFYALLGISFFAAKSSFIIFFMILIFSTYGIGKELYNKNVGLLAALVVLLFPMIISLSKQFLTDFPLTAMVTLTVYFLIKTDYFENKSYSILFGISLGFTALTKWSFSIFIIGPFLLILIQSRIFKEKINVLLFFVTILLIGFLFIQQNLILSLVIPFLVLVYLLVQKSKPLNNTVSSLILALLVAAEWYYPNMYKLQNTLIGETASAHAKSFASHGFFETQFFYFFNLNYQISTLFFLVFIVSLLLACFHFFKEKKEELLHTNRTIIMFLWIVLPYILFTLVVNKGLRFTAPFLPAIALFISANMLSFKNKKLRVVLVMTVIILGLIQFYAISYSISSLPSAVKFYPLERKINVMPFGTNEVGICLVGFDTVCFDLFNQKLDFQRAIHPQVQDWKIIDAIKTINEDYQSSNNRKEVASVAFLTEHLIINKNSFDYYITLEQLPFKYYDGSLILEPEIIDEELSKTDYLVLKTGDIGRGIAEEKVRAISNKILNKEYNIKFKLIQKFDLPDNSTMFIYKKPK